MVPGCECADLNADSFADMNDLGLNAPQRYQRTVLAAGESPEVNISVAEWGAFAQQQFDALADEGNGETSTEESITGLYIMLGSLRGLIEAMSHAQGAINQISWPQWTTARF